MVSGPAKLYDENGDLKREGSFIAGDKTANGRSTRTKCSKKLYYKKGEITREVPVKK